MTPKSQDPSQEGPSLKLHGYVEVQKGTQRAMPS